MTNNSIGFHVGGAIVLIPTIEICKFSRNWWWVSLRFLNVDLCFEHYNERAYYDEVELPY